MEKPCPGKSYNPSTKMTPLLLLAAKFPKSVLDLPLYPGEV